MYTPKRSTASIVFLAICVFLTAMTGYPQSIKEKVKDRINAQQNGADRGRITPGKNRYTIKIDGDEREYFVHVPHTYGRYDKMPVVFMLHGTSGDGEKFYDISGWKELGEKENILTVYPSSWRYCVIEQGRRKRTTKWNVYPGSFEFCKGETPRDDIKFLSAVIDEVTRRFKADEERIYFVGFSNGAQMTARVGIELSERVAAVVSSAGLLHGNVSETPKRLLPNLLRIGTEDRVFIAFVYGGQPAPMDFEDLFQASPILKRDLEIYERTYRLSHDHQTGGDPKKAIWLTEAGRSGKPENILKIELIKGLGHVYPNKRNFPMSAAEEDWSWLRNYTVNGVDQTGANLNN